MTNKININELRDRAYKCAKAHGWHDTELSDEHFLWLVITELAEATNAHRCNKRAKTEDYNSRMNYYDTQNLEPDVYNYAFKNQYSFFIKDSFEDELADTCIRLLDLAGLRNLDLSYINNMIGQMKTVTDTWTEFCLKTAFMLSHEEQPLQAKILYILGGTIDYSMQNNIDILWYVERKMKYNELRPYKHDKLY